MLITTEQAKQHLKINATLAEKSFSPFIPDAEQKYILPFLGEDLFTLIEAYSEDPDSQEYPELDELYKHVIPPLARFTLLLATPHLDVNIGESGFTVQGSSTLVPASNDRVKRFTESTETLAWNNMESLLVFLEANKANYPEWTESDAYTMAVRNLINSATEFNRYVYIQNSRLTFHRLRTNIDNTEQMDVIPLISKPLYDTLIDKLQNPDLFTDQDITLMRHLKYFVANKVAHMHLDRETKEVYLFHYNQAREYINTHIENFPEYAASTSNDEAEAPFSKFDNQDENSIFLA